MVNMSGGESIDSGEAMQVAMEFMTVIGMSCERRQIAGSLRRGKDQVHDIEIVAQPKYSIQNSLLDQDSSPKENLLHLKMKELLARGTINTDRPRKDNKKNPFGEKYYRINYSYQGKDYPVDLFVVIPPAQWGVIYLIRTGSADFSHWFVQQGYRYGIKVVDGHLEKNGKTITTENEEDVFREMHVPWREPRERT